VIFFLDTNVLVYSTVEGKAGDSCRFVLEAVARGNADGRSSPAVLEEVWHLETSGRIGKVAGLAQSAYAILTPLLPIDDQVFRLALSLPSQELGTNDRIHAATCLVAGIEVVVSADAGFDNVKGLRRVDPFNARAVARLLA
jgi:predicted nucleic acid-binding protein